MSDNVPDNHMNTKCAHPRCYCKTSITEKYCSEYCRRAGVYEECRCGHGDCMQESIKTRNQAVVSKQNSEART